MACNRNLALSSKFTLAMLGYQPIDVNGDEPALTAANLVKQTILGPPFDWRWNRTELVLPLQAGQQDYTIASAAQFGYLNRAVVKDTATGAIKELTVQTSLSPESASQRPQSLAIMQDDNAGNVTVRVNSLPDKAYTATLLFAHKAVPMTSLACTWAPIPDELAYIYEWGYLAILSLLVKDARMPIFRQMFLSHLLGQQDALEATKREIFLGNFLALTSAQMRSQMSTQQGMAARQV